MWSIVVSSFYLVLLVLAGGWLLEEYGRWRSERCAVRFIRKQLLEDALRDPAADCAGDS